MMRQCMAWDIDILLCLEVALGPGMGLDCSPQHTPHGCSPNKAL